MPVSVVKLVLKGSVTMPVSVEKVAWFVFYMDQGNRVAVCYES